jgi:exopolysaccharide biosynthesis polyprenyl glycosylphosphotransferase
MLSRRRHGIRVFAYFLVELLVLSGAFFATYWLRKKTDLLWGLELGTLSQYLWIWPAMLLVWSTLLWGFNTYQAFRTRSLIVHGFTVGTVCMLGTLALFSLITVVKAYEVNRSFVGLLGIGSFLGLFALRTAATAFLTHYTQKGYDRHYVIIGGPPDHALQVAEELEAIHGMVYQVRGFVTDDPSEMGRPIGRWTVLGRLDEIPKLAEREPVDEVFLLPPPGKLEAYRSHIEACEAMGMTVYLRLAPFDRQLSRLSVQQAPGGDYLTFSTAPKSGSQLALKRAIDVAGAMAMLLVLSPFLLVVALLVKLTSRGPAVFRQDRAGMNGRVFTLYKFRTMVEGAERDRAGLESRNEMDGPVFKIKEDPRVTWVGRLLRRTSIDELPQLWNVVKGDMSLVGPRPLPLYEVEKFERWQRRRMTMRPGITCLWQVRGRNRVTDFAEWMKLDLEYVDRWSLGLDLKILLQTIPAVLGGKGAY